MLNGNIDPTARDLAEKIADFARSRALRVAAAESLTSGLICNELGAAPRASEWFAGGVVAYDARTKAVALGVDAGPVVTARCAEQMKGGVIRLLQADYAVAVTGVGGPNSEEGKPSGLVYICSGDALNTVILEYNFPGDPASVLRKTVLHALQALWDSMQHDAGDR